MWPMIRTTWPHCHFYLFTTWVKSAFPKERPWWHTKGIGSSSEWENWYHSPGNNAQEHRGSGFVKQIEGDTANPALWCCDLVKEISEFHVQSHCFGWHKEINLSQFNEIPWDHWQCWEIKNHLIFLPIIHRPRISLQINLLTKIHSAFTW